MKELHVARHRQPLTAAQLCAMATPRIIKVAATLLAAVLASQCVLADNANQLVAEPLGVSYSTSDYISIQLVLRNPIKQVLENDLPQKALSILQVTLSPVEISVTQVAQTSAIKPSVDLPSALTLLRVSLTPLEDTEVDSLMLLCVDVLQTERFRNDMLAEGIEILPEHTQVEYFAAEEQQPYVENSESIKQVAELAAEQAVTKAMQHIVNVLQNDPVMVPRTDVESIELSWEVTKTTSQHSTFPTDRQILLYAVSLTCIQVGVVVFVVSVYLHCMYRRRTQDSFIVQEWAPLNSDY